MTKPERNRRGRLGRGPTPGSWKPGTSGNPGGRPHRAMAAVDAVRERVDPHEWVEFELAAARDQDLPREVRAAHWRALVDRGFVKAPVESNVNVTTEDARDLGHVSDERLAAMLAELEGRSEATDAAPASASREPDTCDVPCREQP